MINDTHIVIDLETLGNNPAGTIATIGMVAVNGGRITQEQYLLVDTRDAQRHGMQSDAGTALWWMQQGATAQAELRSERATDRLGLSHALMLVADFVKAHKGDGPFYVWANSPSFDCVILRSAFELCRANTPWPYYVERDLRTLLALYPAVKDLPFEGIKHHALHDARHEAMLLIDALKLHHQGKGCGEAGV